MSLTKPQIKNRLWFEVNAKTKKSVSGVNSNRLLNLTERQQIIVLCGKVCAKLRLEFLTGNGPNAGRTYGQKEFYMKNRQSYFEEKNKLRQMSSANDHSPHYIASLLKVNVSSVYRVIRQYAFTGTHLFKGDQQWLDSYLDKYREHPYIIGRELQTYDAPHTTQGSKPKKGNKTPYSEKKGNRPTPVRITPVRSLAESDKDAVDSPLSDEILYARTDIEESDVPPSYYRPPNYHNRNKLNKYLQGDGYAYESDDSKRKSDDSEHKPLSISLKIDWIVTKTYTKILQLFDQRLCKYRIRKLAEEWVNGRFCKDIEDDNLFALAVKDRLANK
jgi:hypothetical protein